MSYKRGLIIAVFLFGTGLVLGLSSPASLPGLRPEEIAALKEFAEFLSSLPKFSILSIILIKNVSALLISFAFSPFFCLMPVLALILNGWLLGFVSVTVIQEKSLSYLLAGLLPHGIFEVPALIMGEAVALSFGTTALITLFSKGRGNLLRLNFRQNLRYLAVALFLLLPSAVIETYLTPLLLP